MGERMLLLYFLLGSVRRILNTYYVLDVIEVGKSRGEGTGEVMLPFYFLLGSVRRVLNIYDVLDVVAGFEESKSNSQVHTCGGTVR